MRASCLPHTTHAVVWSYDCTAVVGAAEEVADPMCFFCTMLLGEYVLHNYII